MFRSSRPIWALDPGTIGFERGLEGLIRVAAGAGYDAIEIPVMWLLEFGPRMVRSMVSRAGLVAPVYSCPWDGPPNASVSDDVFSRRMRALPRIMDAVEAAGGAVVSAFFNGERKGMQRLQLVELAERCSKIGGLAVQHGLCLAVELHEVQHARSARELVTCGEASGGVGLLLDSFHCHRTGVDARVMRTYGRGSVKWVHLSGVPLSAGASGDGSLTRVAPFKGENDLASFLVGVEGCGYEGPLSIEVLDGVERSEDGARLFAAEMLEAGQRGWSRWRENRS